MWRRTSTDGGQSWIASPVQLNPVGSIAAHPAAAVDGQTLYAGWADDRGGVTQFRAQRSSDGGTSWDPDQQIGLRPSTLPLGHPQDDRGLRLSASDGAAYAAWQSQVTSQWSFNRSTDAGFSWLPNAMQGGSPSPSLHLSSMVASSELVGMAWTEYTTTPPGSPSSFRVSIPTGVVREYGDGTPGSGGITPTLRAGDSSGMLESTPTFAIDGALGGATAVMLIGITSAAQVDFTFAGTRFLVSPTATVPIPLSGAGSGSGNGSGTYSLPSSTNPVFLGEHFNLQAAILDPAGPLGAALSNGVVVVFG